MPFFVHPQRRKGDAPLPGEVERHALLIIGALVDEEGIKRFAALVAQRLARKRLEHGLLGAQQAEVLVLPEETFYLYQLIFLRK